MEWTKYFFEIASIAMLIPALVICIIGFANIILNGEDSNSNKKLSTVIMVVFPVTITLSVASLLIAFLK